VPAATGSKIDSAGEEKKTSGSVSEGMYDMVPNGRGSLGDRC
jgi:hypothetical protein